MSAVESCARMVEGDGQPPPGSPRGEVEDGGTVQCDDWILASIYGWVHSGRTQDAIVEKVMSSFDLKELRTATSRLRSGAWITPNITVPQEAAEDYSRRLAEVVVKGLTSIQDTAPHTVQFWVSAVELHKVPGVGAFPDQLGPPVVSARLSDVDGKLQEVLDRLKATEQLEHTVAGLAKTVTKLQEQMKEQQEEDIAAAGGELPQAQVVPPKEKQVPATYADRVRIQQDGGRTRSESTKRRRGESTGDSETNKQRRVGSRESRWDQRTDHSALSQSLAEARRSSEEVERQQEAPFTVVQRRRKAGVLQKGTSVVQAKGGVQAPFSVFVSGTSPDSTVEEVKEKLILCAASVGGEHEQGIQLEILKVEHIPLKIPQGETPRSRCWKVSVSPQFAGHMGSSAAYPSSWGWRRWNRGPQREEGGNLLARRGSHSRQASQGMESGRGGDVGA